MGDAILRKGFQFQVGFPDQNDWEIPNCAFCCSGQDKHRLIFKNVQEGSIDLVECNICGLRFYSPRPKYQVIRSRGYGFNEESKVQAKAFFKNLAFNEVKDRERQMKSLEKYYGALINEVRRTTGLPSSVFEVGGLIGVFLFVAKSMGVEILGGCELNPWAVEIAHQEFGLTNCECGDFNLYVPSKSDWQCGVMLDVLEHVYYPFDDLKKLSSMTAKGGSLLLKTFIEDLDVNRVHEAPMGHFYHFKRETLQKMIESAGYEIKKWVEEKQWAQAWTVAVKV